MFTLVERLFTAGAIRAEAKTEATTARKLYGDEAEQHLLSRINKRGRTSRSKQALKLAAEMVRRDA